jgi:hypothetical protein
MGDRPAGRRGPGRGRGDIRGESGAVSTRDELVKLLIAYDWLLHEVARVELGETAEVDIAVQRAKDRLLATSAKAASGAVAPLP